MSPLRLICALTLGVALLAGCSSAPTEPQTAPAPPPAPSDGTAPQVAGLAVYEADADVPATVGRLQQALGEAGMVVATVDHAANAASVGEQLRPTTLVIGGNPQAGTPVQQESTTAGVDLPAKFLVWQDEDGQTWVGHNTAEYVAARAGVPADSPAVAMLARGLDMTARTASGSEQPSAPGALGDAGSSEGYLQRIESPRPVPEVVTALQGIVEREGLATVATVDHAANARSIGEMSPPSTVLLAGNPEVGTRLIAQQQTIGIDLPTRYLAWSDAGSTTVGFPDPAALATRHGLDPQDQAVMMVSQAQQQIAQEAAGN